jgi:signal transduction histidine kinase/ActR/RegA family two-component response regulator
MSERGASDYAGMVHAHWRTILMVIVATLGAGVLAALIIIVGDANRARDRALTLQSRSYEVMILTRALSGTMARAEATLGRFVISANNDIGQRYFDEWVQAGGQIQRLARATRDNPAQARRVAELRRAYAARGGELSLIALSTRYKKNAQALARYYQASDAASLARIDGLLESLTTAERALLRERSAAAEATVEGSNFAAKVLASFGIAIVIGATALGWVIVRTMRERAVAAAEAEAERERAELLEQAVSEATEELHSEAREREAAEAKLRQVQKLDAVGQLTGGIAHDFNNMLAVVIGGIELARRRHEEGSDEVERHLESAAEGASRAAALTRRLLAFARSEPLVPQPLDPAKVIADMSDLLDRTLGETIRVETVADGAGWQVWADRYGLENAILNLAVNARDAMEGRGTLTISTSCDRLEAHEVGHCAAGDHVMIAVSDTGCGMAADIVERVFEPFFTTKPIGKGTGLGLSQIFGFVRQSEGEIAIDTLPGEGCTVRLYLPRHLAVEAPAPAPLPAVPAPAPPEAHELSILVVEDDPRVLAATVGALEELGHSVTACGDPMLAGEAAATAGRVDLILSDVLMPGKTGPEIVAELKTLLPDAGVVFVTGFAGDAGEQDGFGDHVVLRKPFTIAGLAAAIDRAMADRGDPAPAQSRAA